MTLACVRDININISNFQCVQIGEKNDVVSGAASSIRWEYQTSLFFRRKRVTHNAVNVRNCVKHFFYLSTVHIKVSLNVAW